jgi:ankyrin repeat protein
MHLYVYSTHDMITQLLVLSQGASLLHWAADGGHLNVMRWLMDRFPQVDVNAVDREGSTALHYGT